jgi:hypothetical protein
MRLQTCVLSAITTALVCVSMVSATMPAGYAGTVFDSLKGKPAQIPGFVNAPYFDKGADGVTFHYTWSNMGDCYWRGNDASKVVSLQYFGSYKDFKSGVNPPTPDSACYPDHANAHFGWIQNGEWFNYTVHVNTAGSYKMIFHESVVDTNHLVIVTFSGLDPDSVRKLPVSIRPQGDHEQCHDWKWDTTAKRLQLDTGLYVMKVTFTTEGFNFHGFKFILDGTPVVPESKPAMRSKGFSVTAKVNKNILALSYALDRAGATVVTVFDCAGRAVVPPSVKQCGAGSHSQTIDLGKTGRGVYFVKVEQNGVRQVRSFSIGN